MIDRRLCSLCKCCESSYSFVYSLMDHKVSITISYIITMIPSLIDGHIIHHMIAVNKSNMSRRQYHFSHGIEKHQLVRKYIDNLTLMKMNMRDYPILHLYTN